MEGDIAAVVELVRSGVFRRGIRAVNVWELDGGIFAEEREEEGGGRVKVERCRGERCR